MLETLPHRIGELADSLDQLDDAVTNLLDAVEEDGDIHAAALRVTAANLEVRSRQSGIAGATRTLLERVLRLLPDRGDFVASGR